MISAEILKRSKELKKNASKIFGLLLLGTISFFCTPIFAFQIDRTVDLKFTLIGTPIFYKESLYSFTDQKEFKKLSLSGQEIWKIQKLPEAISDVSIWFNKIFFVEKNGGLSCYDADYGFRLWDKFDLNIESIRQSYPLLLFKTKTNQIGCLDITSGHLIWVRQESRPIDHFLTLPNSLVLLSGSQLTVSKLFSGEPLSSKIITGNITAMVAGTDNALLFKIKNKLGLYYLPTSKLVMSPIIWTENCQIFSNRFFISKELGCWKTMDCETGKKLWEIPVTPSETESIFELPKGAVAMTSDKKVILYSLETGKKIGDAIQFPRHETTKPLISFKTDNLIGIVEPKRITYLSPEKKEN